MWDETAFEAIRRFTKFEYPTLAEELNGKDNEGYDLVEVLSNEDSELLDEPLSPNEQVDKSVKGSDNPVSPSIIPTQKIKADIVRKKYNLCSKPMIINQDDDNDDDNDEDINVISSSKNVAFSA